MTRKPIIILLRSLIFIPHLLIFSFSSQKVLILEDVQTYMTKKRLDLSGALGLLFLLENDKYYRKMFYHRISRASYLVKWYAPGASTFFPQGSIGGGVYLPHPYATILNAQSIGKHFTCRQCTTIGNKEDGRNDLRPTIGDNVTLGANVCIVGDIHIGNNVVIGCGSVVVRDVPDNSVVAGNPARVIKEKTE